MHKVVIPATEYFDEETSEFIQSKGRIIIIEHSLVSLSKWESKWHKPFLSTKEMTREEAMDYIRCMTITQNVDPNDYYAIPQNELDKINSYIADPMTATWFAKKNETPSREIITSERIYYWMIENEIPVEFEKWHLNRLLTLIRVCTEEANRGHKKMSRKEMKDLNMARRKKYNTRG